MGDIITSEDTPTVSSTQKKYIWAKPTDEGFEYYTYTKEGWQPLVYTKQLQDLENILDPDGDGEVNSSEPLGLEEIQNIYNKVYNN